jgi:inorganic triphosphatase YgiF
VSEIETPILILLNDTNLIREKIKELISTNGYKATEAETVIIHDEYYDTQTNVLKKNKANLRIRSTNNKGIKITLKQEKEKNNEYFDRIEIEKSGRTHSMKNCLTILSQLAISFIIQEANMTMIQKKLLTVWD